MKQKIFVEYVTEAELEVELPDQDEPWTAEDVVKHIDADQLPDNRMLLWVDVLDDEGKSVSEWDSGVNFS